MPSNRSPFCHRGAWLIAFAVATISVTIAPSAGAQETPIDDQTMAEARRHFQAGVNLLDDPDGARYEEAYHAFHKAYALSRSPKVLGNIGFCSLKLERDGEAIEAYTTYLRESRDVDPRERSQIEKDIATLSSTIASFKAVVKSQGEHVLVDTRIQTRGAPVVNAYSFNGPETTIRLRPGRHSLKLKTSDTESRTFEVTVEPSSKHTHEFTFAPSAALAASDARRPRPSYAGPIVLGIAGLAGVATGTVAGLMARGRTSEIESTCPNDLCPASYDLGTARSEARTLGTIADAAFIGGGVALGGALLWGLLTPGGTGTGRSPRTGSPAPSGGVATAGCAATGCSIHVGGRF